MIRTIFIFLVVGMLYGCFPHMTISDIESDTNNQDTVIRFTPMPFEKSREYLVAKYTRCYAEPSQVGVILTLDTTRIYMVEEQYKIRLVRDIRQHAYTTSRTIVAIADVEKEKAGTRITVRGPSKVQVNGLSKFILAIIENHGIGRC